MSVPGRPVTLVLFCLFGSATSSPVINYTPDPPLSSQLSPPSSFPSLSLPSGLQPPSPGESTEGAGCQLKISPSTLVVRFGEQIKANCSKPRIGFPYLGWDTVPTDSHTTTEDFLVWSLDNVTTWNMTPTCFALSDVGGSCTLKLPLIIYQPPNRVSITLVNTTWPMLEGQQYVLQCTVHNVAPVEKVTVTFYRGQKELAQLKSNITEKSPVNESFNLSIIPCKEHDRTQYWCEAKLELGPAGPQLPPVVKSEKLTTLVQSPQLVHPVKQQLKDSVKCEVKVNPPSGNSGTTNSSRGCFLLAALLARIYFL
ncbi:intercellular adhesion molecule 2-like isoform 2-T2 [Menidia menidia]